MNQHFNKVLPTRCRWDAYMTPLFLGAMAIGIVCAWQTGQLRFAISSVAVIPVWMMLRVLTPREGMRVTPGGVVMLWFASAGLLSMAILLAIDIYVCHHPFRAPLQLYHAALFAPPLIIMFTGAFWADRINQAQKTKNCPDEDDGSIG